MTAMLRLGTRGSALALAQASQVAARLGAELGVAVELVHGRAPRATAAVLRSSRSAARASSSAPYADALARGEVDLAVHSLKDLPTGPTTRGCGWRPYPPSDGCAGRAGGASRADSRRAARRAPTVGTGSPRRAAQLHALGLGLDVGRDPGQRRHPPADGGRRRGSTPWSSPGPDCCGLAGSTRSPRPSTRCRCCPHPGRVRWPSRLPHGADEPARRHRRRARRRRDRVPR